MSDKFFLGTNILVYSFDVTARQKRARAQELIGEALTGRGMISTQVVQEFVNVATKRFAVPLRTSDITEYMESVLVPLCEVYASLELCRQAIGLMSETGFAFYDCLILAGALQGGCGRLYTEDMQDGRTVRALTIVNPFREQPIGS